MTAIYWLHVLKIKLFHRWFPHLTCPECGKPTIKLNSAKGYVCDTCGWSP